MRNFPRTDGRAGRSAENIRSHTETNKHERDEMQSALSSSNGGGGSPQWVINVIVRCVRAAHRQEYLLMRLCTLIARPRGVSVGCTHVNHVTSVHDQQQSAHSAADVCHPQVASARPGECWLRGKNSTAICVTTFAFFEENINGNFPASHERRLFFSRFSLGACCCNDTQTNSGLGWRDRDTHAVGSGAGRAICRPRRVERACSQPPAKD